MSAHAGGGELSAITTARGGRRRRAASARGGLALVAVIQAEVGVWGLIAPRSFFESFPGAGHHWVSALGAYDEHLVRDFAAAELGLAVLLIAAALWFERRMILVAGAAFLAASLPHFAYHLITTGAFSTADDVASLGAFVLELVFVVLAMIAVLRAPRNPERSP